jgi:hypothetical protein
MATPNKKAKDIDEYVGQLGRRATFSFRSMSRYPSTRSNES